ncbi:MAG TPA: DUF2079 domain-containing protein, partial [Dehalococcoidia bacterium]|nr:DUF2079 domain-containing protein [Dehalococcoidia bacterium]
MIAREAAAAAPLKPGRAALLARAVHVDVALLGVGSAALACAVYYASAGLRVQHTLHTTAFDLAFFDQIIWNTARGHPLETTYLPYSFFGQHWQPLLLLFVLPYRLGAGPDLLIVVQAAGACAAAVPLFLAARRLAERSAAALLSLAYLVAPALQHGLDFGFHPELFEPLFAFGAVAALLAGRRWLFVSLVALLLCAKEDACLLGALL